MDTFQFYGGGVVPKYIVGKRFSEVEEGKWVELVVMDLQRAAQSGDVAPRIENTQWEKDGRQFTFSGSLGDLIKYELRRLGKNQERFYRSDLSIDYASPVVPAIPGVVFGKFLSTSGVLAINSDSNDFDVYALKGEHGLSGRKLLEKMGIRPRQGCMLVEHPEHSGEQYWQMVDLK